MKNLGLKRWLLLMAAVVLQTGLAWAAKEGRIGGRRASSFCIVYRGKAEAEEGILRAQELRLKNRVIVDEVERRHRVIDRAVKLGVNRAALL